MVGRNPLQDTSGKSRRLPLFDREYPHCAQRGRPGRQAVARLVRAKLGTQRTLQSSGTSSNKRNETAKQSTSRKMTSRRKRTGTERSYAGAKTKKRDAVAGEQRHAHLGLAHGRDPFRRISLRREQTPVKWLENYGNLGLCMIQSAVNRRELHLLLLVVVLLTDELGVNRDASTHAYNTQDHNDCAEETCPPKL